MATGSDALARAIDDYYDRVLGVAYQVLGDAGLATRAAEHIFRRIGREHPRMQTDRASIWRVAGDVLRENIARGYLVRPLRSDAAGWQATLIDDLARLAPEDRLLLLLRYHEGLDNVMLSRVWRADLKTIREQVAQAQSRLSLTSDVAHALR